MRLRILSISLRTAIEVKRLRIRINVRSHLLSVKRIEGTDIAAFLIGIVAPDAGTNLEPVSYLSIDIHPAEIALVTGIVDDTRIVNV